MRKSEILECLRLYRKSLHAYGELVDKLKAVQASAEGFPILPLTQRRLEAAEGDLDQIGEGLAVVPELAEELLLERRFSALLRRLAVQAGLRVPPRPDDFVADGGDR